MNISDIIAASTLAVLIFFTVGGMYISARRTTLLCDESRISKTILKKFPSQTDLDHFDAQYESKVEAEANETLQRFAQAFVKEVNQSRKGMDYPTPQAKYS
jgi:hypothetical protein